MVLVLWVQGVQGAEIHVCVQYGDNTLSWRSVHKRMDMLKKKQATMTDAQCMGHHSTSASDENLEEAWCLRTD
jgi:hypothetical protein